jgi:hypothetical protein
MNAVINGLQLMPEGDNTRNLHFNGIRYAGYRLATERYQSILYSRIYSLLQKNVSMFSRNLWDKTPPAGKRGIKI